ncbi:MaoC family dehydratase [uncultured Deefgea sp.]|uniref:MaoC family dehydratase n=1 Tax=uncultured Deefgea sp. TaxID=1304914 RepID=UPI00260543D2|nr:MaoC family dehydratase [uncultured Deefgea sp.]
MNVNDVNFGGYSIEDISIGMKEAYCHTISDADIKSYAGISGDNNPVHMSKAYAASTRFKDRIAHGFYSAGFFSALFGTRLPGPGCVYVSQNLKFIRPVYINDEVIAVVEVTALDLPRGRVFFSTRCFVNEKMVIDGEAELYLPKK